MDDAEILQVIEIIDLVTVILFSVEYFVRMAFFSLLSLPPP